ncbi:HAD hydrolase family protein [Lachnospiraceae bacterium 54-53]
MRFCSFFASVDSFIHGRSHVNKGTSLLKLAEMLGIRREGVMACGDGLNDLDMLNDSEFAVVMGNAAEVSLLVTYGN